MRIKYLASLQVVVCLLINILGANSFAAPRGKNSEGAGKIALVYKGPGACKEQCAEAAGAVAEGMGFTVHYVTLAQITKDVFTGVTLWMQPGGNAITVATSLGAEKLGLIRKFVRDGGAYVGFCAGAFLTDKTVDDAETIHGLGIIPIATADLPVDSRNGWGTLVWVYTGNEKRQVFFNGGATFTLEDAHPVNVISTYGYQGLPATIQVRYGKGNVVVTGAHPEALDIWKTEAKLDDTDGSDVILAEQMIRTALEK